MQITKSKSLTDGPNNLTNIYFNQDPQMSLHYSLRFITVINSHTFSLGKQRLTFNFAVQTINDKKPKDLSRVNWTVSDSDPPQHVAIASFAEYLLHQTASPFSPLKTKAAKIPWVHFLQTLVIQNFL